MKYLDNVDSEGGPLLIADAEVARKWRGSGNSDYDRACQVFIDDSSIQGHMVSIRQKQGLVWEIGGAGTADVFLDRSDHLIVVRAWLDDPADEMSTLFTLAALPRTEVISLGSLEITSGVLAILWAPESGECIESLEVVECERPTGEEMMSESSGLLVALPNGIYSCLHDEVKGLDGEARRCHLTRNA